MSKKKRDVDYIKIVQPDGKDMIANPEYISKLLGFDRGNIMRRLSSLESRTDRLESPIRQKAAIDLLMKDGKAHTYRFIENRIRNFKYWDLDVLLIDKKLIEEKAGTHTVYRLA